MMYSCNWHAALNERPTDMKQFIVFVRKEFRHIFRDRKSLLIIIMMPIVQIILFGFALTTAMD